MISVYVMQHLLNYTGAELRSHFVYQKSGKFGDCVLVFVGEMNVSPRGHMVDLHDVTTNDGIYSPLAVQFIIEHFNISLEVAVLRQRLFMLCATRAISSLSKLPIFLEGDDILCDSGKLSVSIATTSPVSCLIHAGINVVPVPSHFVKIKTSSLEEITHKSWQHEDALSLGERIANLYIRELEDVLVATCKVLPVS